VVHSAAVLEIQFANLWDAICSAAGLPQRTASLPAKVGPRLTEAILTPTMLARPSQESIGRGAALAHPLHTLPRPDRPQAQQRDHVAFPPTLSTRKSPTSPPTTPTCRGCQRIIPSVTREAAHRGLRRAAVGNRALRSVAGRPVAGLHEGAAAGFRSGLRRNDISQQMRSIAGA